MSCGIPALFSLLWSIRDTIRPDPDADPPAAPPPTIASRGTASTTTRTRTETRERARRYSTSQSQSQSQAHSQAIQDADPHFSNDRSNIDTSETPLYDRQGSKRASGSTYSYEHSYLQPPSMNLNTPSNLSPAISISDFPVPPASSLQDDQTTTHLRSNTQAAALKMTSRGENRCYATLLTRPSYLPGVVVLAHTLRKYDSRYPLVVLVTDSLPKECVEVVEDLGREMRFELAGKDAARVEVKRVDVLLPNKEQLPESLIAARFEDTWTKLRVFGLTTYDAVCFLDADIALFNPIDEIFTITDQILPDKSYLAATHACVCNLDRDSWADSSWTADNCAYTPQRHPSALTTGPNVPLESAKDPQWETHTLLNGGVFVFYPSPSLWDSMLQFFRTTDSLKTMKFPDQDFLALFFRDRWRTVPWRFNALKTMRYWHENIWARDEDVVALHYIVDKPWSRRIASDGIAGHLGRDGETHGWWWKLWEEWVAELPQGRQKERSLGVPGNLVAQTLDDEADRKQVEENKEQKLPVPVPEH